MEIMETLRTSLTNMILIAVLSVWFFAINTAQAHTIQSIKGEKALVILEEPLPAIGDLFQVLDEKGEEMAQIQIRQIKEKRAVAYIIKGTLSPNQPAGNYQLRAWTPPPPPLFSDRGYYVGLSQNQMNINLTSSTALTLSGTSFNFGAFVERPVTSPLHILARIGYEGLQAKGSLASSACGGDCKVDIGYLSTDALIKYSFSQNKKIWWFGGGLGFLFPMIKSSNVLDTGKITLSERVILAGGVQWFLKSQNYIPLQIEYSLQPSTKVVSTRQLLFRVGYGTSF